MKKRQIWKMNAAAFLIAGMCVFSNAGVFENHAQAKDAEKTVAETESGIETESRTDTQTKTESRTDTQTKTKSKADTQTKTKSKADTQTKTKSKADTQTKTKSKADIQTKAKSKTDIRIETESGTDIQTNTESETKSGKNTDRPGEQLRGKALEKGDCIGIVAPAGFISEDDYNQSLLFLRDMGYEVKLTKSCTSKDGLFAGSDEARANDINALFEDDSVDAILCLRGGYGSARILEYLDYDMIAQHPKLLIGYSDISVLLTVLAERCNLVTIHGPMISSFRTIYTDYIDYLFRKRISAEDIIDGYELSESELFDLDETSFEGSPMEFTVSQFQNGLQSDEAIGEIELPEGGALKTIVPGTVEGRIIGGNLTVLTTLTGTEYELQGDHVLLFLEEVQEPAYRIDRMFQQLYQNGLLDRVSGILIGDMSSNIDDANRSCMEVVEEYARLAGKPCISGIPAGHGTDNMYLPFNVEARLTAREDGTASLVILEPAAE